MTLHDTHGHSHGHSHGGSHSHGHSHGSEDGRDTPKSGHSGFSFASVAESTKSQDINIRAAMVHVIGDLLQVRTHRALSRVTEPNCSVHWRVHCLSTYLSQTVMENCRSNMHVYIQVQYGKFRSQNVLLIQHICHLHDNTNNARHNKNIDARSTK